MASELPERRMVRGSGFANSIRIFSSFFCSHIWPDSLEISFTTSVYLMCSTLAVSVRKSRAPASILSSTDSRVHFCADCANNRNGNRIRNGSKTGRKCLVLRAGCGDMSLRKTTTFLENYRSTFNKTRYRFAQLPFTGNPLFLAKGHLVGRHSALFVANRFDVGDLKAAILQGRLRALQSAMQFVLQLRHLLGRGQNPRVHLVGLQVAGFGEQLDLSRSCRHDPRRLVAKPAGRGKQNEDQDGDYGEVVLPGTSLVGP